MAVKPREPTPPLDVALAGGGRFILGATKPKNFTLVVFYRGLHCQRCKGYLGELDRLLPEFARRGVDVVAVSADPKGRAETSVKNWGLSKLKVGYGVDIDVAREWGLFISRAIRDDEWPIFTEPGTFLVDPDGRLNVAVINSITRMRPYAKDILDTIDRLIETKAPARGEA